MLELLQAIKPVVLIETGMHHGASALYFAEMMSLLGLPVKIITIDINPKWHVNPEKYGIEPMIGYSTERGVIERGRAAVKRALGDKPEPVMVKLDSDHSEDNVTRELELYTPMVTRDSYLIVEDTINGHPAALDHGPGPWEAVEKFLIRQPDFIQDRTCERHLLTFFPGGWLKRIR